MKYMKKALCVLTLALFSFALLTGCGGSGDRLSDPDTIETYGSMIWDNKLVDVCFTHDQEKIYIYYDDGKYKLFETVDLPVEDFHDGDNDWRIISVDLTDATDNGYSDLRVKISHSDTIESSLFWTWSPNFERFVYQPTNSFFYIDNSVDDTPAYDFSVYGGIWSSDEDNMYSDTFIEIDSEGNWQLYAGGELADEGYLYILGDDGVYVFSYEIGALNGGHVEIEDGRLYIDTAGYFTYVGETAG